LFVLFTSRKSHETCAYPRLHGAGAIMSRSERALHQRLFRNA